MSLSLAPWLLSCSPLCSLFLPFYHSKWNGLEVTLTAKAPKAEAVDADAGKPTQPLKKRARKADDGSIR